MRGALLALAHGPRRIDGARPLLFERLLEPDRPSVLDAPGLEQATAARLEALLATQAPVSAAGLPASARRVIDYGAGPKPGWTPAGDGDRRRLAEEIRAAVTAFEPRLSEPAVEIEPDPDAPDGLRLRIAGIMRLGRMAEPFRFIAPLAAGAVR